MINALKWFTLSLLMFAGASWGVVFIQVITSASLIPLIVSSTESDTGTATATTLTLTKPTGSSVGDLFIVILSTDDTSTGDDWNVASGWTKINEAGNSTSDCSVAAHYRVVDGTEGATQVFTTTSADELVGIWMHITGAATSSVIDVVGPDTIISTGTTFSITGITTTQDNTLALFAACKDGANGLPSLIWTEGWTIHADHANAGETTGASSVSTGSRDMETAGQTHPVAGSVNMYFGVSESKAGFVFSIAPN